MFFQYIVFGISLAISIGPVNIELIKQGITRGFLPSWLVGIGGMSADFVILSIIFLGLGSCFTSFFAHLSCNRHYNRRSYPYWVASCS
ncbi:LysE family transporter [Brevibacillus sp. SYSU BS000544]|uniref:LysE family transporter n=1 Tax=Brevibacillus sp. SYSU BS000544 TaxID=3416443 RepID=UPI003CE54316